MPNKEDESFECLDCRVDTFLTADFMIHNVLWNSIVSERESRKVLCFQCTEKRLGRKLGLGDLTDCPLNKAFFLGYKMAKEA